MRYVLALHRIVNPDSIGSYEELVCFEPISHEDAATSQRRLHDWALAMLTRNHQAFGMYHAAITPLDEHERPNLDAYDDLIAEDADVTEDYLCWSGESELVPA
ncbi:hypothetical protein [Haloactinomyces albus]|uniref:Uncharacterized protein n=1 Tax=Haloactinomyces albus TaxID=1352928 RepID=A0AAE3ZGQ7_9ACTN|nr:hypothetical protein [Haloactinomyces albus]MDR7303259.1 hypothetical protein [Haloactinomyces albus]